MIPDRIAEISNLLRTQDNRCTDSPIFIVEEQHRTYGFDTAYSDKVVWLNGPNDNAEATPEEHAKLEAGWNEGDGEPQDWTRTGYQDTWHFVTACFTEAGCNDYIKRNGHNHRGKLRTYAASSYRNEEWRAVRSFLMSGGESAGAK